MKELSLENIDLHIQNQELQQGVNLTEHLLLLGLLLQLGHKLGHNVQVQPIKEVHKVGVLQLILDLLQVLQGAQVLIVEVQHLADHILHQVEVLQAIQEVLHLQGAQVLIVEVLHRVEAVEVCQEVLQVLLEVQVQEVEEGKIKKIWKRKNRISQI